MGSPALGIIMILQRSIRVRGGMGLSLIPALSAATSSGQQPAQAASQAYLAAVWRSTPRALATA